jgi:hypothetical protein
VSPLIDFEKRYVENHLMLHEHESLEEACRAGHVVRRLGDYDVSGEYRHWCAANTKPFIAITQSGRSARYACVEMDLLETTCEGFGADAGYELLHFILGQPLKPRSAFTIDPTYISAWVRLPSAKPVASFLYRSAIDEGILLPQEDLKARDAEGLPFVYAFKRFSGDVYPEVLAEMETDDFWQSMLL